MDIDHLAEVMGITIIPTDDLRPDLNALYIHHRQLIIIQKHMDWWTYRSCIAHELGHAFHGDSHNGDTRLEKRADYWAAELLIDKDKYRAAEEIHGPHVGAIAHDLGVTPDVVNTWCDIYSRTII